MFLKNAELVGFDLMETLVHPPAPSIIQQWIKKTSQYYKLTEFQKHLFLIGFPYAAFVDTIQDFEYLKRTFLSFKNDEILSKKNMEKYSITCSYTNFFIENSIFPQENRELLIELRKRDIKLVIISNLYPTYKKIIQKFSLDLLADDVILSCDCGMIKPSQKIFNKGFNSKKNSYFIGDNYKSDIFPLLNNLVTPVFYTQSKLIYFIKQYGILPFVEHELKLDIQINKAAFKHLSNIGIIPFNEQNLINENEFVYRNTKLTLESIDKILLINNLTSILS